MMAEGGSLSVLVRQGKSLEHSYFHKLSKLLWGVIVTLVVGLAIYVSFGRLLMSSVALYSDEILLELNSRIPFSVSATKVSGEWHFFSPEIVFSELEVVIPDSTEPPYRLTEGRVTLDVAASLASRNLQVSKLLLDALSLRGELSEEGKFSITGFGDGSADISEWLEEFLLNIRSVDLTNNSLTLILPNDQRRQLKLDLGLRRNGSSRVLEAEIVSQTTGTVLTLTAEGVGNPLRTETFVGEMYLGAQLTDLKSIEELVNTSLGIGMEGALTAQFWLGWEFGEPTVELSLEGQNLLFTGTEQAWQLPADQLSLQASVVERKDHWTVFVSDFEFRKDDIQLLLARLQLDIWGDSLRVRSQNVPLAAINALVVDMSLTPPAIADVFQVLNTRGELNSVQVDIADTHSPGDDWQVSASFTELEVDSWRGAPGISSANGFVELAQHGGYVILDSQSFAMHFPTVYQQALFYDDFFGTIYINWDDDDFTLSSGLLSARGEEGLARVLFGLNIPLEKNDIGLEMDLLVGLEDFDPVHRKKYLPYILSDSLLDWLKPSIVEGVIDEGGFLWRGNLRGDTPKLKTIQLFFNVSDIELDYHPEWPPVSEVEAIVLIDDTNVSVWSDSGSLYQSKIQTLSAESWMNDSHQMVLAIGGQLEGPAEDGLKVVNNSPIDDIVGSAFQSWEASGLLQTDLQLELILTANVPPPKIEVNTVWHDVDLRVNPGNLLLTDIEGQFSYNSEAGFSSQGLNGELWGRPLTATLSQGESSSLLVDISTDIAMTKVQQWLGLDVLAFASGKTAADIQIAVTPGEGTTLFIDSQLLGVGLDLPEPWGKSPDLANLLHLSLPLGDESSLLALELNSGLTFKLQLLDGQVTGGALALSESPHAVESGVLRISGHTPVLDVGQWQDFVNKYINDELLASLEQGVGMSLEIDNLGTDTLQISGQDIRDVVLNATGGSGTWNISAETDWVSGSLLLAPEQAQSKLNVYYLDLDALAQLDLMNQGEGEPLELPDMTVSLQGIHKREHSIGGLDFTLVNEGSTLVAKNIVGNIVGLEITEEAPATLKWFRGEEGQSTKLDALFTFGDLSHTLDHLGYEKILETESGKFDLDLQWPAAPHNFSLLEAEGKVTLAVEQGSFLSAPEGASGALRVLSIFNLAEIIGRLSMSHMFESGIPFHSVDGEIFFSGGEIEVANMDVDGSTSGFQFSGVADVAAETLEGNLAVTLPVASNLPWIVALTAGLPVAAGVFVVSKVFKKQVNRFSSGVYSVSGPWDDPQMKFIRIFDDSSKVAREPKMEEEFENGQLSQLPTPDVPDPNDQPVTNAPQ